ncbi:hypothetical protein C8J57DRAFT_1501107 [Mycena rebaudengoi]|nr:hypothetical protein C8J57DRAFT_1501107 [Mycena rebaudengoi]
MPSDRGEALLPELPTEPTIILAAMGWALIDYVHFLRLQTAFLYPDGDQVNDLVWARVPVMRGIFRASCADEMDTTH